jgi:hypothetical protein
MRRGGEGTQLRFASITLFYLADALLLRVQPALPDTRFTVAVQYSRLVTQQREGISATEDLKMHKYLLQEHNQPTLAMNSNRDMLRDDRRRKCRPTSDARWRI